MLTGFGAGDTLGTAGESQGMHEGSTFCRTGSTTDQLLLKTAVEKGH